MTVMDEPICYSVTKDRMDKLKGCLEVVLCPTIQCDVGDSEVTLLRKQIRAMHEAAEKAAFIVARLIDGVPF